MIKDAKDKPLNRQPGNLPRVSSALRGWFQQVTFVVLTRSSEAFRVDETSEEISFMGVVQPMSPEQLQVMPEGERSWSWWTVHAEPGLVLKNSDRITYLEKKYKVMNRNNFEQYGYVEYQMIEDFE